MSWRGVACNARNPFKEIEDEDEDENELVAATRLSDLLLPSTRNL
jgi:hypothetical protein